MRAGGEGRRDRARRGKIRTNDEENIRKIFNNGGRERMMVEILNLVEGKRRENWRSGKCYFPFFIHSNESEHWINKILDGRTVLSF